MSENGPEEERARRARLPDLTAVELSEAEWEQRARDSGLYPMFDVEGRPAAPTDDDRYDAAEAAMRAEGRVEEADRFAAARPPRASGAPPRGCFVDDPDPHRRGPPSIDFELRVSGAGDHLIARSIRALITPGRPADGRWATLIRVDGGLHVAGHWTAVPDETFERLLAATADVFGAVPRYQPDSSEASEYQVRSCRGGVCAGCDEPIADLGIRVGFGREPLLRERRFHLLCATPEDVQRAIEFHRLGEDDLSEARRLEQGTLCRCQACKGLIRKETWRLAAVTSMANFTSTAPSPTRVRASAWRWRAPRASRTPKSGARSCSSRPAAPRDAR